MEDAAGLFSSRPEDGAVGGFICFNPGVVQVREGYGAVEMFVRSFVGC